MIMSLGSSRPTAIEPGHVKTGGREYGKVFVLNFEEAETCDISQRINLAGSAGP
jgi:hypothetical protein